MSARWQRRPGTASAMKKPSNTIASGGSASGQSHPHRGPLAIVWSFDIATRVRFRAQLWTALRVMGAGESPDVVTGQPTLLP
jgi:hypothetical protein